MKGKRPARAGYTLVEVVVALAVSAVLFASMIAIMAPIYRIYTRTRERADAQLVAGAVLESIRAACLNARFLETTGDGSRLLVGAGAEFWVENGVLMFDGDTTEADTLEADTVLARGVYNGKTISLFCEEAAEGALSVTVTVSGGDGVSCALTSVIRPMRAVLNTPAPAAGP